MANLVAIAAREGGGDSSLNFKLKLAIDKAKNSNVPAKNIERAIKRGIGKLEGARLEQVSYEAYGSSGAALIIQAVTDKRNRTLPQLRKILSDNGGRLVEKGSVAWMFKRRGVINLLVTKNKPHVIDDLILLAIDCGAQDVEQDGDSLLVYVKAGELRMVEKCMEGKKIRVEFAEIDLRAKELVKIEDKDSLQKIERLVEELGECDDVVEIYSNIKD